VNDSHSVGMCAVKGFGVVHDGVAGTVGHEVGVSHAVDGISMQVVSMSESGESMASAVGSNSSGVSGLTVDTASVGEHSNGMSHSKVGVSLHLLEVNTLVMGSEVMFASLVSSVRADSHPVDGLLDASDGSAPFGVPVSEASEVSSFVFLGGSES